MKRVWVIVVLLILLLAAGGGGWFAWRAANPPLSAEERMRREQYRDFLMTTGSGHHGEVDSGGVGKTWKGSIPFYRDGPLMVYAPQAGWRGEARRPVFVLLMRLHFGNAFIMGSEMTTDGESIALGPKQYDSEGKEYVFRYKAAGDPIAETIEGGGTKYDLQKGRVFLLDLNAKPPTVTQLKSDIVALFAKEQRTASKEELKAAVSELAQEHGEVKAFLDAIERLKAEKP